MKYERIRYPDGQISARIDDFEGHYIQERINSYEDLMFVRSLADVLQKTGRIRVGLFIPCLFGQRSDRRFGSYQSFDLKIIADVINSCDFQTVDILDPHSDVALALINRSQKITSYKHVQAAIIDIESNRREKEEFLHLVSPDAGAYKKVFEYGQRMGLPVVAANKFRDSKGEITLQFLGDVKDKECLIVDDLCDGGYTFIQLGKALKEQGARKVYLYVSHGYFSKGFDELWKYIDHIYCTNSVKDLKIIDYPQNYVTQYKVI